MEKYLEKDTLSPEEIFDGLRKRTLANEIVPAYCGSAFKNKGVQTVLDGVVSFLPSPDEVTAIKGYLPSDESSEKERLPSDDEPFSGLASK